MVNRQSFNVVKELPMNSPRTFPDAAFCSIRHVHGQVYKCLADDACRCPYSLAFAYSFYCKHPDCKKFDVKVAWYLPVGYNPSH